MAPWNKSEKKTPTKCSLLSVCTGDNQGKQEPLDEEGYLNYYCLIAQVMEGYQVDHRQSQQVLLNIQRDKR